MVTNEARTKTHRILASVGVFHPAFQEIGRSLQIPSPTNFRIWKTLLIADRPVGHGRSVASKLRRSGWRQMTPELKRTTAYTQPSESSTRHFERSRVCPRYLVRHLFRSGRGSLITENFVIHTTAGFDSPQCGQIATLNESRS